MKLSSDISVTVMGLKDYYNWESISTQFTLYTDTVVSTDRKIAEYQRFLSILRDDHRLRPETYSLIIKSNIKPIESLTVSYINQLVKLPDWDIAYIHYYLGLCNEHKLIDDNIYRLASPHGTDILLFSPSLRKDILYSKHQGNLDNWLNKQITEQQLIAIGPNHDVVELTAIKSSSKDLAKYSQCRRPRPDHKLFNTLDFLLVVLLMISIMVAISLRW